MEGQAEKHPGLIGPLFSPMILPNVFAFYL